MSKSRYDKLDLLKITRKRFRQVGVAQGRQMFCNMYRSRRANPFTACPPTAAGRAARRDSSRTTAITASRAVATDTVALDERLEAARECEQTRSASLNACECWKRSNLVVSRAICAGSRVFPPLPLALETREITVC